MLDSKWICPKNSHQFSDRTMPWFPWPLALAVLAVLVQPASASPVLGPRNQNAAALVNPAKLPLHTRGGEMGCLGWSIDGVH